MKKITENKWVWMPHAGHLIVGSNCQFHLNTKVGKYIVSTVGEYWPDRQVREIHAKVHDPMWLVENKSRLGDDFDHEYFEKFGWMEIGLERTYETMVFKARRDTQNKCCPWTMVSGELDMDGYKFADKAYQGHLKMCRKWAQK